jgi:predicted ATPase
MASIVHRSPFRFPRPAIIGGAAVWPEEAPEVSHPVPSAPSGTGATRDIFISYSTRDRSQAEAVCAVLEDDGIACWIAPRDAAPGISYAESLVGAIAASRLIVIIFSKSALSSDGVLNELEIAFNRGLPILAVRIEDVQPYGAAEFYLRRHQWFEAHHDFASSLAAAPAAVRQALAARVAASARSGAPSAPSRTKHLPRQASSFVGRAEDLARVTQLLGEHRLVTVAGTGGVGKTRLALETVERLEDVGEGAWFIDLAPLPNPDLIAATVLSALGARQPSQRSDLDELLVHLSDRRLLLLVDNCEHLVHAVAALLESVLGRCPQITVLATSREALHVAGEHVYRLDSLDDAAALRLFAERAQAANQQFELDAENTPAIVEICRRVDGIALAIELAAARVRMISVDEIARRLDDRFRILTGGSRAALPRHQTVRALVDWSFEHLTQDERLLFRRTALFTGGFTLEAVTGVCAGDGVDSLALLDLLGSLVDKSLVAAEVRGSGQRYRMLQTIFDYAKERLDESGEATAFARRHATFFADFAREAYEEWDAAPAPDWLRRTEADLGNLRSALTWTLIARNEVALGARLAGDALPIFLRLSLDAEGIEWGEVALRAASELPPPVEGRLLYGLSMLYNNRAALDKAVAAAERAVELYHDQPENRAATRALAQVAQLYARGLGRRREARVSAERAIASARRLGDDRLLASTLQRCAMVFTPEEIEHARAYFGESVALFRRLGRDEETARALSWWAIAESAADRAARALELTLEARDLQSGDDKTSSATAIASYYLALGRREEAAESVRSALALVRETRHPILLPMIVAHAGAIASGTNAEQAARLFGYGDARLEVQGWHYDATASAIRDNLLATLRERLGEQRLEALLAEGAAWSEDQVVSAAARF